ncbi:MAG: cyclic nucleotide-binding/CBS domain-containing protein [Planctomycetota bacterium]
MSDAIQLMAERKLGLLPVLEDDKLIGVFSERDLLRRVIVKKLSLEDTRLREVMTPDPVTASPLDSRESAIRKMRERGCRHLPIMEGGKVVDMLSMKDLLRAELSDRVDEIKNLQNYIQGN